MSALISTRLGRRAMGRGRRVGADGAQRAGGQSGKGPAGAGALSASCGIQRQSAWLFADHVKAFLNGG